MPRPNPVRQATFAEYLKPEETSEVRRECVDGFMFAMAEGTTRHNRIANRINRLAYRSGGCGGAIKPILFRGGRLATARTPPRPPLADMAATR
jgi:Uma2 family endonuclease